ncbi:MAG: hypothetical protein AB7V45_07995 [Candidatus Krumholzibacteriia bacterium]
MFRKSAVAWALGAFLVIGAGATASAQPRRDPIVRMDASSTIELDLGLMVEDLLPLLMEALAAEDPETAPLVGMLVEQMGLEALQTLRMESRQTRDHGSFEVLLKVGSGDRTGLLPRLLTLPNASCRFGKYVPQDRVVMFSAYPDVAGMIDILLDFLTSPELAPLLGEVLTIDEAGDLVLEGFTLPAESSDLLTGEMDLFLLEGSAGDSGMFPMNLPFFLVLGSTDGMALRDELIGLLATMAGESGGGLPEMIQSLEPEAVGGFEVVDLPFGGALAAGPDFLVLGLNPRALRELIAAPRGDLEIPDGVEWIYVDGPRYGAFMESMMGMASMMTPPEAGETEWMMDVYSVMFAHMETEEILYRTRDDGLEIRGEIRGPLMSGLYRMAVDFADRLPEIIEEQKMKAAAEQALDGYREAVGLLDEAMMAWAAEHGGSYPEDPLDLLTDLYLEEWPLGAPVPAGEYEDWGYTYHPLLDETGTVAGYFLFVYGGDPESGHDVYTPDNLETEGNFRIAKDGIPDGVISFCYDGLAFEQMDAYYAE